MAENVDPERALFDRVLRLVRQDDADAVATMLHAHPQLVTMCDADDRTLAQLAARAVACRVVHSFVSAGIRVSNEVDECGYNALGLAVEGSGPRVAEEVDLLLKLGADPNADARDCAPAIVWAGCWGKIDVIDVLLRGGANINAVGKHFNGGETALWKAAFFDRHETVRHLLELGADRTLRDEHTGRTAEEIARERGSLATLAVFEQFAGKLPRAK